MTWVLEKRSSVSPSAAERCTASTPMRPPAPMRFSTTTCCFHISPSRSPIRRAVRSAAPPTVNVTITFTGLLGKLSALACAAQKISAAAHAFKTVRKAGFLLCSRRVALASRHALWFRTAHLAPRQHLLRAERVSNEAGAHHRHLHARRRGRLHRAAHRRQVVRALAAAGDRREPHRRGRQHRRGSGGESAGRWLYAPPR